MLEVWMDADFNTVCGEFIGKYGVKIVDANSKAQKNKQEVLGAGKNTENIQHEYKQYVPESQGSQLDGNGFPLSIPELH
jgi:hypothetical protein